MSDDHITPDWIRAIFPRGEWFDPCPYPRASFDGLKIPWKNKTFANIPYSRKRLDKPGPADWIRKAINEHFQEVRPIALLIRHDHSTDGYLQLHKAGAHFLLINERVQFLKPDGTPNGDSPNFLSTLAILA